MIPTVAIEEAKNFAKQWNYNGVAIPTDDVTCRFATDFANVCLRSFVEYCQKQAMAAMQAAKAAAPQWPEPEKKVTLE